MSSALKDDLDTFLNCSICLDTFTELKLLPCAHRFCQTCLIREMDRSASSGPRYSFPCPLCKRRILLARGKSGKEWIHNFETDRLLKGMLERMGEVQRESGDMCDPHVQRLRVVCYSCKVTECMQCAWEKHRQCNKTEHFNTAVVRIEYSLRQNLHKIEKSIKKINCHVKAWAPVKKSLKHQALYSNKFIKQCVQTKKDRFDYSYSRLTGHYDSYARSKTMSWMMQSNLKQIMEMSKAKLEIDGKCKAAELRLKESNKRGMETDAAIKGLMQLNIPCERQHLINIMKDISRIVVLSKSEMVIQGQQLLTDKKDVLTDQYQRQILANISSTFILKNLITREDQVDFGIEDEEKLFGEILDVLESADDLVVLLNRRSIEEHVVLFEAEPVRLRAATVCGIKDIAQMQNRDVMVSNKTRNYSVKNLTIKSILKFFIIGFSFILLIYFFLS